MHKKKIIVMLFVFIFCLMFTYSGSDSAICTYVNHGTWIGKWNKHCETETKGSWSVNGGVTVQVLKWLGFNLGGSISGGSTSCTYCEYEGEYPSTGIRKFCKEAVDFC